jgi:hypothetical protein
LIPDIEALALSLQIQDNILFTLSVEPANPAVARSIQETEMPILGQALAMAGTMVEVDGRPIKPAGDRAPRPGFGGARYTLRSHIQEKPPTFTLEIRLPPPDGNTLLIKEVLQPQMVWFRGIADMAGGQNRIFELSQALQSYVKEKNAFPRGTAERKGMNFGRPFPPDQRVSWMAELLPFLGYEDIARNINSERSWRVEWDKENKMIDANARMGAVLIPQFLDGSAPPAFWYLQLASIQYRYFAATQFVGIAGVGLDAAEYDPADAAQAKKMGVFGYNRQTKPEDIKDGPANTIALIEVPPTYKRPWIAGGGATVAGVPEKKSIDTFVCVLRNGKPGTYAIMADGTVRFISKDIPDDVFKAMCTINGGEKVDLEKHTELVPPPGAKP